MALSTLKGSIGTKTYTASTINTLTLIYRRGCKPLLFYRSGWTNPNHWARMVLRTPSGLYRNIHTLHSLYIKNYIYKIPKSHKYVNGDNIHRAKERLNLVCFLRRISLRFAQEIIGPSIRDFLLANLSNSLVFFY